MDCKEFREFALYGRENVSDRDLPHRTKLVSLIFETYEREHRDLKADFKVCDPVILITVIELKLALY